MLLVYMLGVLCLIVCDQFGHYAIDLGAYVCYLLVHHDSLVWFHVLQLIQQLPQVHDQDLQLLLEIETAKVLSWNATAHTVMIMYSNAVRKSILLFKGRGL